jgi:hypothetical protein
MVTKAKLYELIGAAIGSASALGWKNGADDFRKVFQGDYSGVPQSYTDAIVDLQNSLVDQIMALAEDK